MRAVAFSYRRRFLTLLFVLMAVGACGKRDDSSHALASADAGARGRSSGAFQVSNACPLPYRIQVPSLTTYRVPIPNERAGKRVQVAFWGAWDELALESVWFGRYLGEGEVADQVQVTFAGQARAEMPIGRPGVSDPFAYEMRPGGRYAVSFAARGAVPEGLDFEFDGVSAPGDLAAQPRIEGTRDPRLHGVRWLAIEGESQRVVAVLGDSIGAGQAAFRMEERFIEVAQRELGFPVVDASIGGDGIERSLMRLERDVLALPGVTDCVVQVGTNDLHREDAQFLIDGLTQAFGRLRAAGIRPWAGTIIPKGPGHLTAEGERTRLEVNDFLRTAAPVEGVVDFDAEVRDPADPSAALPGMLADGIHPRSVGHRAMATAMVKALRAAPRR